MHERLHAYIEKFNADDEELYAQDVKNADAEAFLRHQIPLIECPDKVIEETYYFRWWTFRKHIRSTEKGPVITEFLPDVPWSGPYNTIVCPASFHLREGRWLADPDGIIENYIRFWLDGHGRADAYSSWLPHAVLEYCEIKNDFSLAIEKLPQMIDFYTRREEYNKNAQGLYFTVDGADGMEVSIGGSGYRSTGNSYACADARAIARIAEMAGESDTAARFTAKAEALRSSIETYLWRDGFYRTIPAERGDEVTPESLNVPTENYALELHGYVPWYFDIPEVGVGRSDVFAYLRDPKIFLAPHGLTTADMSHPRFMYEFDHDCLWNGPVWPFATSQTLVAYANMLRRDPSEKTSREDYLALLHQYAASHRLVREDGREVKWIDENLDPFTGDWIARRVHIDKKFKLVERGKDYNHSLFCDLVLSGLFGISVKDGELAVDPLVPDSWDSFRIENLHVGGRRYRVTYEKGKAYTLEY